MMVSCSNQQLPVWLTPGSECASHARSLLTGSVCARILLCRRLSQVEASACLAPMRSGFPPPMAESEAEATRAESIHCRGSFGSEQAALRAITKNRSIVYLCTDEGGDTALEPEGFKSLHTLGLPGHVDIRHFPLDASLLSLEQGHEVLDLLRDLGRPTLLVSRLGGRASAVKALYIATGSSMGPGDVVGSDLAKGEEGAWAEEKHLVTWVQAFLARRQFREKLVLRQLVDWETRSFTYLLADAQTREAVLIDPMLHLVERDMALLEDLKLRLVWAINTQVHARHTTSSGLLARRVPGCQSAVSEASGAEANKRLQHGDRLWFGRRSIEARATPGHSPGAMCFLSDDYRMAFTGETLLIRGCGRSDLQTGSTRSLYRSLHSQLLTLPSETLIYPAHDARGVTCSSMGEEKRLDPLLRMTRQQLEHAMGHSRDPLPDKFAEAVRANLADGLDPEGQ